MESLEEMWDVRTKARETRTNCQLSEVDQLLGPDHSLVMLQQRIHLPDSDTMSEHKWSD